MKRLAIGLKPVASYYSFPHCKTCGGMEDQMAAAKLRFPKKKNTSNDELDKPAAPDSESDKKAIQ